MKTSRKRNLKEHTIWFRPDFILTPFLEITQQTFTRIGSNVFRQIRREIHFEIEDKRSENERSVEKQRTTDSESRLDCSGQGECQPGIVPSDGDDMQNFLVKANKKPRCKRNQAQRKKSKKQANIS